MFGMGTMNSKMGGVEVGNRTSGRNAAVNKLKGNGEGMRLGNVLRWCSEAYR